MRRLAHRAGRALWAGIVALACNSGPAGAGSPLDAGAGARVPESHRPGGATCPQARGAGVLTAGCPDAGAPSACAMDSDCAAGQNGRCLPAPGVACGPQCSYDTCQSDGDCKGTACVCRASGSDSAANACAPGNCAVDADCGPGGYCSPSGLSGACGLGYYCHSPSDSCLDDADCPSGEGCNFDPHALAWSCSVTCTRPP